ncbi:bifunctional adenosylcobinamide kinase/adenosylcobinamide-phosphate guanylyltransferase [Halarcobacter anaerophilus]|uniref:Adenosylcobinamide kinase n=1 Tax=Halarcobacter anaerophilus TaxID=877500 RepID=A0A4Q0Y2R2_9BACT|nr:bifunctional adenosylcobinamide kinase/adenosylcobinamide-phosphate guanylyltransferase [Halarcobacter anaerophilus]QDF29128.1 adenosylcobinamide kinase / adenosylcobinamide-phosphate guanylyltransferase [Halarcobacter anaerophilus]RXJ64386.1 cobinamide phosphate guanylyltransferase [Halarcobacter anaerophilus]
MKILYFGGQKSGKSSLAEKKALEISTNKPYYIATYDNSYDDKEMKKRVNRHKEQREKKFTTIEEAYDLTKVVKEKETFLVDCISMWIFNNLEKQEQELINQLEELEKIDCNIVFVLNEVTSGVIPFDKNSRKFVDLTGIIGQKLAKICDEVYEVKFGLESRLK